MDENLVRGLDPSMPAPPMVVERNPNRDAVGHGRDLPLVGGQRPYVYDVVFNDGARRVYADTIPGVLSAFIDYYGHLDEEARVAEDAGDQSAVESANAGLFEARAQHATDLRVRLQRDINTQAEANGTWDTLDEEEVEQCTKAASGEIPVGVLYEVPLEDLDGSEMIVDKGFWTHSEVRLVINRGDYELFDPDFTPEPESLLSEVDSDTGKDIVYGGRWPENLVILDPTEEDDYIESLEHAGQIEVTVRPVDLPDDLYLRAVQTGREILAAESSENPS